MSAPIPRRSKVPPGGMPYTESFGRTIRTYSHPHEHLITDTREQFETPEGAIIHLRPAGMSARVQAFLIDELIKFAFLIGLSLVLSFTPQSDINTLVFALVLFGTTWFYGVAFEIFNDGRTPGKRVANLKVVNADGTPIRLAASLLRNLLRVLEMSLLGVPSMVSMAMSRSFKRIGDHVADTIVIYTDGGLQHPSPKEASGKAFPVKLSGLEQTALTDFQDRVSSLSRPRAQELAEILTPIHGAQGDEAVQAVLKYANGIRGNL